MGEFQLNCPHCDQLLVATDEMLEQKLECPSCHNKIVFSDTEPQETSATENIPPPVPAPQTIKACPYCGEEILKVARKCKHCGEILDVKLKRERQMKSRRTSPSPRPPPPREKVVVKQKGEGCFLQTLNIGCLIIFIIIVAIVLVVIGVL